MQKLRFAALILSSFVAASSAWGQNQSLNRADRWEFVPMFSTYLGKSYSMEGGSNATTYDSVGLGLGVGYNVDNHLRWGGEITWNTIDYRATINPGVGNPNPAYSGGGTMDTLGFNLNGTYHFFSGRLTPLVTGGAGFLYVDTNVPAGPALPVCWYYPWYGYYCGAVVPTKADYFFSMTAGAGVRWDVSPGMYLQATARRLWVDVSGYKALDGFRFEIGFRH